MRIFIIGSGVVGTATGRGFVEAGHRVTFVDVRPERVDELAALGLDARTRLDLATEEASFVFLTLPTPNDGTRYDLTAFLDGTRAVGRALRQADAAHTVVVRSTVTPGTTEGLVGPVLERESGLRQDSGFLLASNPEFLRAASAEADFRWPWMTVVGARNKRVRERLAELFTPFGGILRLFEEPMTAELVKCAHNIFNATKISFWNEMYAVARRLGLDPANVAGTVARSAEGSLNPEYGIRGGAAYGGACLPKDTMAFLGFADTIGVEMPLLRAVVEVNDRTATGLVEAVDPTVAAVGALGGHGWPGQRVDVPEQPTGDRMVARVAESPTR
ncbi:UDP-glucose/GDP-mannose dehydrogenase family protein [Frankia sp. CNm7]|uniref:UDP-glucose/GDP-mannose dehydrogenase family protein n=1 Tax=Frankia nepalensis TaxID=1836974 RepID=A0A937URR3_9ACTN|nr:NAD(P)-binding domain-containing protein [Frankia nepalensis]MBL7495064.1 UDP-glucose/GDP-mannose dehydrogenase family protein [Frankia nepalensis]MBL7513164.1 UDP-glucose/GDP-mannose dehydrogenase family protein [Frankia nepalensis]MBL7522265.1 UDP-glucose/GDP-mannose dehydrogenase family protein [Frankia nepalensis]MBL7629505.1 UDP-glucose/GDP-mannose dehydrogenase family protein [Frankia nepalensis]